MLALFIPPIPKKMGVAERVYTPGLPLKGVKGPGGGETLAAVVWHDSQGRGRGMPKPSPPPWDLGVPFTQGKAPALR